MKYLHDNNSLFYANLLYLLNLNYEKNNLKKIDFFKETSIHPTSDTNWKSGKVPAQTTLKRICNYFNEKLLIDIECSDLVEKDLTKILINNHKNRYSVEDLAILGHLKKMTTEKKHIILELIRKLNE